MTLIEIFLYNDRRSKNLLNVIKYLVKSIPNIKIKAYYIDINDPNDFNRYLFIKEEYWAGYATLFLRKYDIEGLPAIVIDGEKVLEGRFPNIYELKNILDRISLKKFMESEPSIVKVKPYTPEIDKRRNNILRMEEERVAENNDFTCFKCMFFLKHEKKCLKYGTFVRNPNKPLCKFHQ